MDIFKLFIGPIDPKLELKSALSKGIDMLDGKKKSRVMMTLLFSWKQGHPKCRYSHVVSSQPWYLEARQKRCTHIREAIFLWWQIKYSNFVPKIDVLNIYINIRWLGKEKVTTIG